MLLAIIVTFLVLAILGVAFTAGRADPLIERRPYNNRYSDATGARDDQYV